MKSNMNLINHEPNAYTDYEVEIAGDEYSSVLMLLTYVHEDNSYYLTIRHNLDGNEYWEHTVNEIPPITARFLTTKTK